MSSMSELLVKKMVVLSWKDRLANAITMNDGSFVIGSFPSVEAAENMIDSLRSLHEINDELIAHNLDIARNNPADIAAADEAVFLTAQNSALDKKMEDIHSVVGTMNSLA